MILVLASSGDPVLLVRGGEEVHVECSGGVLGDAEESKGLTVAPATSQTP